MNQEPQKKTLSPNHGKRGRAKRKTWKSLTGPERIDRLAKKYKVDPLEFMFLVMMNRVPVAEQMQERNPDRFEDFGHLARAQASKELLRYRYPTMRALAIDGDPDQDKQISWLDPEPAPMDAPQVLEHGVLEGEIIG